MMHTFLSNVVGIICLAILLYGAVVLVRGWGIAIIAAPSILVLFTIICLLS